YAPAILFHRTPLSVPSPIRNAPETAKRLSQPHRRHLQCETGSDAARDEQRHRQRTFEVFPIEEPHAAVHAADLAVWLRVRASHSLQMRDDAAGIVPNLPAG